MIDMKGSPRVTDHGWGKIVVENHGVFKDVKLWPGGARAWDWRETGTKHVPGVQPEDAEELVRHGAEVIVIGCGRQEALGVPETTLDWLRSRGVQVEVLPTEAAIERYNAGTAAERIGALIHSTC